MRAVKKEVLFSHRRRYGGGLTPTPSFVAPLLYSLILERGVGLPTFTRATTATVFDQDGVLRTVQSGEARFTGARRVRNLLTATEDFNNAVWIPITNGSATITLTKNIAGLDGSLTGCRIQATLGTGTFSMIRNSSATLNANALHSVWIKSNTVSNQRISLSFAGVSTSIITVTPTWQRMSVLINAASDTFDVGCTGQSDASCDVIIWHPQLEDVTGQTNQNPGEYVSNGVLSAPFHGCGIDGVQYFPYLNGNTVSSNIVTQGQGATISGTTLLGYLSEGAATNFFLNSGTPATQTTGSLATGSYTCWLTGTGSIAISAGTATITGAGTATAATPLTFTVTVAGTVVCTVAGTVTIAQVENTAFRTSYIATAGAAVARNADVLSYPSAGNATPAQGSYYAESSTQNISTLQTNVFISDGSNNNLVGSYVNTTGTFRYQVLNGGVVSADISSVAAFAVGVMSKGAVSWANSSFNEVFNGISGTPILTGSVPASFSTISIGGRNLGAIPLYGNIRNVRIWQTQLPNSTLQALTR